MSDPNNNNNNCDLETSKENKMFLSGPLTLQNLKSISWSNSITRLRPEILIF